MRKPKWAFFTASGCRGCENALLDVHYLVTPISDFADVVFWPYVLGSQWQDLEADPEGAIDVAFVAGAVRTDADAGDVRRLRARARYLVAVGACAHLGGMPALADAAPRITSQFATAPTLPLDYVAVVEGNGGREREVLLPALPPVSALTRSLEQVVVVDYVLPGCPPPLNFAWVTMAAFAGQLASPARLGFLSRMLPAAVAQDIAAGVLPPRGTVFAGTKAVCATCSRRKEEKKLSALWRPHEIAPDPERCLLEQGVVCCGIATRGGCGGRCTAAGIPCRGCFGPAEEVSDPGARLVSAISSTIGSDDPAEITALAESLVDPLGTFYRYGMLRALLPPRVPEI